VSDRTRALIDGLRPQVAAAAVQMVNHLRGQGVPLRIISARRSPVEQARLYAQGRTAPGPIVTDTLHSRHLHGTAFDIDFDSWTPYPSDNHWLWEYAGAVGEALGLRWGGRWVGLVDRPHFEAMRALLETQLT